MTIFKGDLNAVMPIYVTRPKAGPGHGTGDVGLSIWMVLLAVFLAWTNVVVWGLIGLYAAVRVFV